MVLDEAVGVRAEAWNHAFGYIKPLALVCAVELELPDILEKHGGDPMSLSELSAATACPAEPLYRLLRFLIFHGIFKKTQPPPNAAAPSSSVFYAQTPLSRLFTADKLGAFMALQTSPVTRHPAGLSADGLRTGTPHYLKSINGADAWADDPANCFRMKIFTDAMAVHARDTMAAIIRHYPAAFDRIGSVVDVGGRHGMALMELLEAFPRVRGITFDLPEIVAEAPPHPHIEFVGGSMFESVPKADAVLLMWVLHDWSDKDCIKILKKCKEAVPSTGKVMIVDAILNEDGESDEFAGARLLQDMIMMATTAEGKERTYKEWTYLLEEAGFNKYTIKNIDTLESVIEAYP